jgi:hypothetical protein
MRDNSGVAVGFDAKNPGSGKTSSVLAVTAFLAKIKLLV